jgi:DNA-binding response OmpR family regulator
MKILVVEDDRSYRALLFEFLHSLGHDVLAVSDAVHAIALLTDHSHEIDLVLLDFKMPRMSGEEVMQSFAHWSTCRTRFLIVSGAENLEVYLSHPKVAGILHKPFPMADLAAIISTETARHSPTAAAS